MRREPSGPRGSPEAARSRPGTGDPGDGSGRRRASAADRAYAWTKSRVLTGELSGGEILTEGQVAEAVGVSRTPVREAFLRLEAEGLLRLHPRRGALVVPVSSREVAEVVEARVLVERFAAAKVIATGRAREVADAMASVLREQRDLAGTDDAHLLSALDRRFHATLVAAAGNSLVSALYDRLADRQVRIVATLFTRDPARRGVAVEEHETLCALLRAGDAASLDAMIAAHAQGVTESR
jgi:DNA-binding GntR family transcriptional regulator